MLSYPTQSYLVLSGTLFNLTYSVLLYLTTSHYWHYHLHMMIVTSWYSAFQILINANAAVGEGVGGGAICEHWANNLILSYPVLPHHILSYFIFSHYLTWLTWLCSCSNSGILIHCFPDPNQHKCSCRGAICEHWYNNLILSCPTISYLIVSYFLSLSHMTLLLS